MNAWLKAPSAKKRLKRLGIFKVTTKISWNTDAPNILVVATSLIKPKILETPVQAETLVRAL